MKKRIVLLMCFVAMSAMAQQAELPCNGGTPITSHKATDAGCSDATCNEHTFCKSDKSMNWWSAFAWCESQNRKLADLSVMCPGVSQTSRSMEGDCPNLWGVANTGFVWSSLACNPDEAFVVHITSGAIGCDVRLPDSGRMRYALCE